MSSFPRFFPRGRFLFLILLCSSRPVLYCLTILSSLFTMLHLLKRFKTLAFKLASINSHVIFLQHCITLGFPPRGLIVKLPISGCPPGFHSSLNILSYNYSMQLTTHIHNLYSISSREHSAQLISLHSLLMRTAPHLAGRLDAILISGIQRQANFMDRHLKKLSHILLSALAAGIPIPHPSTYLPSTRPPPPPPLIGLTPSLADCLSMTTPPKIHCTPHPRTTHTPTRVPPDVQPPPQQFSISPPTPSLTPNTRY